MTDRKDEPTRLNQPIRELVVRFERLQDGYNELLVRIDQQGNLVLDGADGGPMTKQLCGDWDYEYWVTVPAAWRDTVLLHLMKERFPDLTLFQKWCRERGIPCKFWSWT
jgi:hypothetical protein